MGVRVLRWRRCDDDHLLAAYLGCSANLTDDCWVTPQKGTDMKDEYLYGIMGKIHDRPQLPTKPTLLVKRQPKTHSEQVAHMLNMALDGYTTSRERAALRCALGDAAALCDGLAREIAAENKGRGGKGAVTKLGLKLEAIAKRCGDEIWAMREKIDVPTQQS